MQQLQPEPRRLPLRLRLPGPELVLEPLREPLPEQAPVLPPEQAPVLPPEPLPELALEPLPELAPVLLRVLLRSTLSVSSSLPPRR